MPATPSPFWYWGSVTPIERAGFPQQIAFAGPRDLYMSQAINRPDDEYEDMVITRFFDLKPLSTMRGMWGHGYPMNVRSVGRGVALITFKNNTPAGPQWVEIPYVADHVWTDRWLNWHRTVAPPVHPPQPQPYWCQGRVLYKGCVYELFGGPFEDDGMTHPDSGPVSLRVWRDGVLLHTIDASMLGRVGQNVDGLPVNGRLEPEGLALTTAPDGLPCLVLNIACGKGWDGQDTLICYLYYYPLETAAAAAIRAK